MVHATAAPMPAMRSVASAATPEFAEPSGSNGWAISGSRTRSGHPMLLINPHTSLFFRGEVHVVSEEGLNAYGAVTWAFHGNHRLGILAVGAYFVVGLALLTGLDVERGRRAALEA